MGCFIRPIFYACIKNIQPINHRTETCKLVRNFETAKSAVMKEKIKFAGVVHDCLSKQLTRYKK